MHSIELDSAYLRFGTTQVLRGAYILVRSGTVTGLLGNNGSGKSCMLGMLYGTLSKGEYNVMCDGRRLMKAFRRPDIIRYAPQFGFTPRHFTAERVFKGYGVDYGEFCRHFPIFDGLAGARIKSLSGGERRLLEVYAVLRSKSLFCILDEPFSQLMPVHADVLCTIIVEEARTGKGILLTDHAYRYLLDISDTIYLLRSGTTYIIDDRRKLHSLGYLPYPETSN